MTEPLRDSFLETWGISSLEVQNDLGELSLDYDRYIEGVESLEVIRSQIWARIRFISFLFR
jgi:hypothetical protein